MTNFSPAIKKQAANDYMQSALFSMFHQILIKMWWKLRCGVIVEYRHD
jgi:hypothetical protein